jgi:centrosomal protein CEP104
MIEEHTLIGYSVVCASSEAHGSSVLSLERSYQSMQDHWECARFASFPQFIIFRLDFRVQFSYIILQTKNDRVIPDVEVYVGDGLVASFDDADYSFGGKGFNITAQPSQVSVNGIGSFLKVVFVTKPRPSPSNPHGQVSLTNLKVWARIVKSTIDINKKSPVKTYADEVDKLLIGMGVPLEMILWSKEDPDSFRYAPIDEDSRETLLELEQVKEKAYKEEDFMKLREVTKDAKTVFNLGADLLRLKRELQFAVTKEDYDEAKNLRNKMKELERIRDDIDAKYETRRYYKMMAMGDPSDSYLAMVNKMMEEERLRNELLRLQQQEEDERHRRYLEELERKRRMEESRVNRKAPSPKRREKKKETKEERNFDDPFVYNEGDLDLEPYFRPRFNEAGGKLELAAMDILKRAYNDKFLKVIGAQLWSCLFSSNWRHREAAVKAFFDFLDAPLLPKYENDTRGLFRAAVGIALIACEDKVMPIYLSGLKILLTAMSSPICDKKVTPKMLNDAMKMFIPILLNKISELNYRARELSMNTLIELFKHPKVRVGPLVDYIMGMTNSAGGPVEKQPWRIVLSRLEILLHIIQDFGADSNEWKWKDVLSQLILPLFSHAAVDVRNFCVSIVVTLYEKIGMPVRAEIEGFGARIKPIISKLIYQQMLDIDQNRGMMPIKEQQEDSEDSPPATKHKNRHQLREQISKLAEEEAKKVNS